MSVSDEVLFYRSELRTLQNTFTNNDEFLTHLAKSISTRDATIAALSEKLQQLEHKVRMCKNGDLDVTDIMVD